MKKVNLIIIGIVTVFLLGSCTKAPIETAKPSQAVTTPVPSASAVSTFIESEIASSGQSMAYYLALEPEICAPFTLEDWTFCGLSFKAESADVIEILGEPESTETQEWGSDGSIHEYHYYNFGYLGYQEDALENVCVQMSGYPGPRGIEVGDTLEETILKFCTTYEKADDENIVFYRENEGRDNFEGLPPCGVLKLWDTKYLYYIWIDTDAYIGKDIETLEEYIPFAYDYGVYIEFDQNDVMISYTLSSGPSAE